jgi:hypothetical protein
VKPGARYQSVDALRGLIMILMAIDHSSALIARQHASEFWAGAMSSYDSAFPFLTRLVTHLWRRGLLVRRRPASQRMDRSRRRPPHGDARSGAVPGRPDL